MYDAEGIEKTLDSYRNAFRQVLKFSPKVELSGTGSPPRDIVAGRIEAVCSVEHIAPHATRIFTRTQQLFDCGAKHLGPRSWIWCHHFFQLVVYVDVPWTAYTLDGARDMKLTLKSQGRTWNLKNWLTNKTQILEVCEVLPAHLADEVRNKVFSADREVQRWLAAVNNRPEVAIS